MRLDPEIVSSIPVMGVEITFKKKKGKGNQVWTHYSQTVKTQIQRKKSKNQKKPTWNFQRREIRLMNDFSPETMELMKQWNSIFKC